MLFRRFRVGGAAVRAAVVLPVLLAFALPGALRTVRAQPLSDIDRGRARNMLNGIKGAIQKTYYDPGFRGIDIEAHFKLASEKLERATSLGHAMGIVAQAMLDFDDSHTFFIPPSGTATVQYGWQSKMVGDRCYVTAVRPGTDAEAKGLKPGDLLVSVQGIMPTRASLWKLEYLLYSLRPVTVMRIVVQSPGGQPRQLEIASKTREGKRVIDLTGGSEHDVDDLIRQIEGMLFTSSGSGQSDSQRIHWMPNGLRSWSVQKILYFSR